MQESSIHHNTQIYFSDVELLMHVCYYGIYTTRACQNLCDEVTPPHNDGHSMQTAREGLKQYHLEAYFSYLKLPKSACSAATALQWCMAIDASFRQVSWVERIYTWELN